MLDTIIGDPMSDAASFVHQDYSDTCAIASQTMILHQFGVNITEQDAIYTSLAEGWYQPGNGTQPDDVGNLLEVYGVPTHSVSNANISQLAMELQNGHKVIVGVNSSELWDIGPLNEFKNWLIDAFGLDSSQFIPADHAICVTGIDISDPNNPMVIVNDPGDYSGGGKAYPLDRFMDAWQNSDFNYVATNGAPPNDAGLGTWSIAGYLAESGIMLATSAFLTSIGMDSDSAVTIGEEVSNLVVNADWDNILSTL